MGRMVGECVVMFVVGFAGYLAGAAFQYGGMF